MSVTYRAGTPADSRAAFDAFLPSIQDLVQRHGLGGLPPAITPEEIEERWIERKPLFDHMAREAESWWLAEQDGVVIGYARAFFRSGMRELTEFFVRPGVQAQGVGKELLARAFPAAGADRRLVLATMDTRALTRYLKVGVRSRFVAWHFSRPPERRAAATDLVFEPLGPDPFDALAAIDLPVIELRRDADHGWLASQKTGFLAKRGGRAVGYGYVAKRSGPFAALDPSDQPAILAHAETLALEAGLEEFGVSTPSINEAVLAHVLAHGFKLDAFFGHVMTDRPFGQFDRYAFTTPSLFL